MRTFRQHEDDAQRRCAREYGTTARDYWAVYPRGSRRSEWFESLVTAARQGETVPSAVERSLRRLVPVGWQWIVLSLRQDAEQFASYAS